MKCSEGNVLSGFFQRDRKQDALKLQGMHDPTAVSKIDPVQLHRGRNLRKVTQDWAHCSNAVSLTVCIATAKYPTLTLSGVRDLTVSRQKNAVLHKCIQCADLASRQ